jgi:hypothetical protein
LDGAQSDIRFPPALCAAIVDLRCFASLDTNVGLRFAPSNLRLTHPTLANRPNGPYATQEFPSIPVAHGFPDIVDNYAGSATKFSLSNGASLYQISGSLNGVAGRFEWIVDPNLGGVSHRMFVQNGSINGIPVKP